MEMMVDITGSPMVPFVLKPHFIQRIYIFIYIFIYIYIHPHAYTHTYTHTCTRTHTRICARVYTHMVFDRLSVF